MRRNHVSTKIGLLQFQMLQGKIVKSSSFKTFVASVVNMLLRPIVAKYVSPLMVQLKRTH